MAFDVNGAKKLLKQRDRQVIELESLKPAAVLMPLFFKEGQEHFVLTKRTETVANHKGQVAFPGGHQEDDEDLLTAALRESHEEVGISPEHVDILGPLDDIVTVTSYRVTPFLGSIPFPYEFKKNEQEIEKILLVPIERLLDDEAISANRVSGEELDYRVYYFDWGGDPIWGATGRIVADFLNLFYGKDL